MGIILIVALVVTGAVIAFLIISLNKRNREYNAIRTKYKDVIDLDEYKDKLKQESATIVAEKTEAVSGLETQISELRVDYSTKRVYFDKLIKEISLYEEQQDMLSYGLYKPHFDFDTSEKYQNALIKVRDKEKELIKNGNAALCTITWTLDGSVTEGRKQTKHYIKLMLRAFNGECEGFIADVRWNNIQKMEERVEKAYEAINKLGETHKIYITQNYYQLKLDELRLAFEYEDKKHQEKEEQKRIREQIREEERVQKEIEKTLKDSEEEEATYNKALEQARKELDKATGERLSKQQEKIAQLEKALEETQQRKQRALSMAQQTKAGHVYVISNIGSFGQNIFKIGMTRRLEPMERIHELGDSSVPFGFDVHAIIYSEDAPNLENLLQREFDYKKVNLVNNRKEFFYVTLEEIERIVKSYDATIELTKIAEAREYKESNAIRESREKKARPVSKPEIEGIPESI